eukprot:gene10098-2518_t
MKITQQEYSGTIKEQGPILKEELSTLFLFADSIYQMTTQDGKYKKVSKEKGWGYSHFSAYHKGYIYVISTWSGCIYKWNVAEQTCATLNKENWKYAHGMVEINGYLYIICKYIYRVSIETGKSEKVSREGGWNSINVNGVCAHKEKILMIDGVSGKLLQWNPQDGSYLTINNESWNGCRAILSIDEKVYVVGSYIYELDVNDGKYKKVSNQGGWSSCECSCIKNGKIIIGYCTLLILQMEIMKN